MITNGCWNCRYGGLDRLTITLMRNFVGPMPKYLSDAIVKFTDEHPKMHRCRLDSGYQIEAGYVCCDWTYDEQGFQERK